MKMKIFQNRWYFLKYTTNASGLTGVVFSIRKVVLGELNMDGRHLWWKVQGLLIAGDHGLWAGATLVRC